MPFADDVPTFIDDKILMLNYAFHRLCNMVASE